MGTFTEDQDITATQRTRELLEDLPAYSVEEQDVHRLAICRACNCDDLEADQECGCGCCDYFDDCCSADCTCCGSHTDGCDAEYHYEGQGITYEDAIAGHCWQQDGPSHGTLIGAVVSSTCQDDGCGAQYVLHADWRSEGDRLYGPHSHITGGIEMILRDDQNEQTIEYVLAYVEGRDEMYRFDLDKGHPFYGHSWRSYPR